MMYNLAIIFGPDTVIFNAKGLMEFSLLQSISSDTPRIFSLLMFILQMLMLDINRTSLISLGESADVSAPPLLTNLKKNSILSKQL